MSYGHLHQKLVHGLYLENCPTQLVIIVKGEHQSSVLKVPSARLISEMEGVGLEASFK